MDGEEQPGQWMVRANESHRWSVPPVFRGQASSEEGAGDV